MNVTSFVLYKHSIKSRKFMLSLHFKRISVGRGEILFTVKHVFI
jgi:hypothetical protein